MIKLDCLKSLLALCENENGAVVEMSLHCIANHVLGDQQMKFAVNVSPVRACMPQRHLSYQQAQNCFSETSVWHCPFQEQAGTV